MTASEFKAKCLAVLDDVQASGKSVTITKRGRAVASLVPHVESDDRPWLRLRRTRVRWKGDPFAPAVARKDIETLK